MIQADDRLKAIFDEAVKIAKSHSHEYVTLEHLLLCLLDDKDALCVLKACAVDTKSLKSNISHGVQILVC